MPQPETTAICVVCGEPMPPGEQMFKFHGYSGPCPKPPLPKKQTTDESHETMDIVDVVRRRLADGRTIADADVHRLVAEIDRLKAVVRSLGGSA